MDFQLAWVLNVAFLGIIPDVLMKVDKDASEPEVDKIIKKVWEKNKGLIYGAKDERHNQAVALAEFLGGPASPAVKEHDR